MPIAQACSVNMVPSYESIFESALRGGGFGALLGLSFHAIGGNVVRAQGRTSLTPAHIAKEGGLAALRLSAVFAGYGIARGLIKRAVPSDALACMGAGGAVVCGATLVDQSRLALLQHYFASALKTGKGGPPVPTSLLYVSSFASGAFLLGGLDLALIHGLGVRW